MFFRYLESARVAFIHSLGFESVREVATEQGPVGFILQSAQCRFRRPLVYPDTLTITTRVASIDADRFTLEHEIISQKSGEVSAIGSGVIVTYDYAAQTKVPMPERLRKALEAHR
jgi:acyl-CoA thioester hydrolase